MPRIITTCPTTGQLVPTGYRSTDLDLAQPSGVKSFRCSSCGKVHEWSARDASVEAVEVGVRPTTAPAVRAA